MGAGMAGLSTAWFLQREGADVSVVDRADIGAGSSWGGNAGWLAPGPDGAPARACGAQGWRAGRVQSEVGRVRAPPTLRPQLLKFLIGFAGHCTSKQWTRSLQTLIEANAVALAAFDEMTGASEAPVEALIKHAVPPHVLAFAREADREPLVHELDKINGLGGRANYSVLDSDDVHALEPTLGPGVTCGISISEQRFINPGGEFVHALAAAVDAAGGDILTGRDVIGVRGYERWSCRSPPR